MESKLRATLITSLDLTDSLQVHIPAWFPTTEIHLVDLQSPAFSLTHCEFLVSSGFTSISTQVRARNLSIRHLLTAGVPYHPVAAEQAVSSWFADFAKRVGLNVVKKFVKIFVKIENVKIRMEAAQNGVGFAVMVMVGLVNVEYDGLRARFDMQGLVVDFSSNPDRFVFASREWEGGNGVFEEKGSNRVMDEVDLHGGYEDCRITVNTNQPIKIRVFAEDVVVAATALADGPGAPQAWGLDRAPKELWNRGVQTIRERRRLAKQVAVAKFLQALRKDKTVLKAKHGDESGDARFERFITHARHVLAGEEAHLIMTELTPPAPITTTQPFTLLANDLRLEYTVMDFKTTTSRPCSLLFAGHVQLTQALLTFTTTSGQAKANIKSLEFAVDSVALELQELEVTQSLDRRSVGFHSLGFSQSHSKLIFLERFSSMQTFGIEKDVVVVTEAKHSLDVARLFPQWQEWDRLGKWAMNLVQKTTLVTQVYSKIVKIPPGAFLISKSMDASHTQSVPPLSFTCGSFRLDKDQVAHNFLLNVRTIPVSGDGLIYEKEIQLRLCDKSSVTTPAYSLDLLLNEFEKTATVDLNVQSTALVLDLNFVEFVRRFMLETLPLTPTPVVEPALSLIPHTVPEVKVNVVVRDFSFGLRSNAEHVPVVITCSMNASFEKKFEFFDAEVGTEDIDQSEDVRDESIADIIWYDAKEHALDGEAKFKLHIFSIQTFVYNHLTLVICDLILTVTESSYSGSRVELISDSKWNLTPEFDGTKALLDVVLRLNAIGPATPPPPSPKYRYLPDVHVRWKGLFIQFKLFSSLDEFVWDGVQFELGAHGGALQPSKVLLLLASARLVCVEDEFKLIALPLSGSGNAATLKYRQETNAEAVFDLELRGGFCKFTEEQLGVMMTTIWALIRKGAAVARVPPSPPPPPRGKAPNFPPLSIRVIMDDALVLDVARVRFGISNVFGRGRIENFKVLKSEFRSKFWSELLNRPLIQQFEIRAAVDTHPRDVHTVETIVDVVFSRSFTLALDGAGIAALKAIAKIVMPPPFLDETLSEIPLAAAAIPSLPALPNKQDNVTRIPVDRLSIFRFNALVPEISLSLSDGETLLACLRLHEIKASQLILGPSQQARTEIDFTVSVNLLESDPFVDPFRVVSVIRKNLDERMEAMLPQTDVDFRIVDRLTLNVTKRALDVMKLISTQVSGTSVSSTTGLSALLQKDKTLSIVNETGETLFGHFFVKDAVTAKDESNVLEMEECVGWVRKCDSIGRFWYPRYLRANPTTLAYYDDDESTEPLGAFSLNRVDVTMDGDDDENHAIAPTLVKSTMSLFGKRRKRHEPKSIRAFQITLPQDGRRFRFVAADCATKMRFIRFLDRVAKASFVEQVPRVVTDGIDQRQQQHEGFAVVDASAFRFNSLESSKSPRVRIWLELTGACLNLFSRSVPSRLGVVMVTEIRRSQFFMGLVDLFYCLGFMRKDMDYAGSKSFTGTFQRKGMPGSYNIEFSFDSSEESRRWERSMAEATAECFRIREAFAASLQKKDYAFSPRPIEAVVLLPGRTLALNKQYFSLGLGFAMTTSSDLQQFQPELLIGRDDRTKYKAPTVANVMEWTHEPGKRIVGGRLALKNLTCDSLTVRFAAEEGHDSDASTASSFVIPRNEEFYVPVRFSCADVVAMRISSRNPDETSGQWFRLPGKTSLPEVDTAHPCFDSQNVLNYVYRVAYRADISGAFVLTFYDPASIRNTLPVPLYTNGTNMLVSHETKPFTEGGPEALRSLAFSLESSRLAFMGSSSSRRSRFSLRAGLSSMFFPSTGEDVNEFNDPMKHSALTRDLFVTKISATGDVARAMFEPFEYKQEQTEVAGGGDLQNSDSEEEEEDMPRDVMNDNLALRRRIMDKPAPSMTSNLLSSLPVVFTLYADVWIQNLTGVDIMGRTNQGTTLIKNSTFGFMCDVATMRVAPSLGNAADLSASKWSSSFGVTPGASGIVEVPASENNRVYKFAVDVTRDSMSGSAVVHMHSFYSIYNSLNVDVEFVQQGTDNVVRLPAQSQVQPFHPLDLDGNGKVEDSELLIQAKMCKPQATFSAPFRCDVVGQVLLNCSRDLDILDWTPVGETGMEDVFAVVVALTGGSRLEVSFVEEKLALSAQRYAIVNKTKAETLAWRENGFRPVLVDSGSSGKVVFRSTNKTLVLAIASKPKLLTEIDMSTDTSGVLDHGSLASKLRLSLVENSVWGGKCLVLEDEEEEEMMMVEKVIKAVEGRV